MPRIDRPDGRDGGGADPTTVSIEPARFPYRCTFVPKRARIKRVAYLTGEDFVNVRRLDANEKLRRLAFRVHFPFRFTYSFMLSETDFEILWFEDRFWWPLTDDFNPEMYPHSGVGVREFLDYLTGGRDFFGLDPAGERVFDLATTNKVIATSKIEKQDRDEVIARLQRAVAERILVVGDDVYALGGEPVYIERRLHGRTKDVTVVSLHPDRTVERGSRLGPYPGYMEFADKYLERRAFHLAGEMGPVRTAAARIGMPENMMPTIESVMPHVNPQSRDDIHADALFRFAVDGRRPWHEDRAGSEGIADVIAIMKSLGGRRTNSETTTGDRFEALVMLKRAIEADEGHLKRCTEFRYLDLHLKPLAASLAPGGDFLAPEDEEALRGL